jgi:hypothetical protein
MWTAQTWETTDSNPPRPVKLSTESKTEVQSIETRFDSVYQTVPGVWKLSMSLSPNSADRCTWSQIFSARSHTMRRWRYSKWPQSIQNLVMVPAAWVLVHLGWENGRVWIFKAAEFEYCSTWASSTLTILFSKMLKFRGENQNFSSEKQIKNLMKCLRIYQLWKWNSEINYLFIWQTHVEVGIMVYLQLYSNCVFLARGKWILASTNPPTTHKVTQKPWPSSGQGTLTMVAITNMLINLMKLF